MGNDSNPKKLTNSGGSGSPWTTTFGSVLCYGININKTLTGTLTIQSGGASGTVIGIIAAGTIAGEYWYSNTGTEIQDLAIINSATEDVTVLYRNI